MFEMMSLHIGAQEGTRREVAGGSLINFQEGHGRITEQSRRVSYRRMAARLVGLECGQAAVAAEALPEVATRERAEIVREPEESFGRGANDVEEINAKEAKMSWRAAIMEESRAANLDSPCVDIQRRVSPAWHADRA
eukprot:CAMPEP_0204250266 /NCGR_PEP_ID=MMETSP0361-20130328/100079_1 /ASSEMBLY_ACC=CAM_ASM_000343 /TAXON_ID=268821 /ORGANISM="Scrippsiella Hangoei, Strain SHTV-5" /LENGTH=136 /DNA_ID=CAMNT_0051223535 /DNA_START=220 /DNA_END=631 /DNA_ORIENTATION=+